MELTDSLKREYLERLVSLGHIQDGDEELILDMIGYLYELHGDDFQASVCDIVFEKLLLHRLHGDNKTILFDWIVAQDDRFGTRRSAEMRHVVEDWVDVMSLQGERMANEGGKFQQLLPVVGCAFVR